MVSLEFTGDTSSPPVVPTGVFTQSIIVNINGSYSGEAKASYEMAYGLATNIAICNTTACIYDSDVRVDSVASSSYRRRIDTITFTTNMTNVDMTAMNRFHATTKELSVTHMRKSITTVNLVASNTGGASIMTPSASVVGVYPPFIVTIPAETPTATPMANSAETPTMTPTANPIETPTATPTANPTSDPTEAPTEAPTETPTATPTANPTSDPTEAPTATPTANPTSNPTEALTANQTTDPTVQCDFKTAVSVNVMNTGGNYYTSMKEISSMYATGDEYANADKSLIWSKEGTTGTWMLKACHTNSTSCIDVVSNVNSQNGKPTVPPPVCSSTGKCFLSLIQGDVNKDDNSPSGNGGYLYNFGCSTEMPVSHTQKLFTFNTTALSGQMIYADSKHTERNYPNATTYINQNKGEDSTTIRYLFQVYPCTTCTRHNTLLKGYIVLPFSVLSSSGCGENIEYTEMSNVFAWIVQSGDSMWPYPLRNSFRLTLMNGYPPYVYKIMPRLHTDYWNSTEGAYEVPEGDVFDVVVTSICMKAYQSSLRI